MFLFSQNLKFSSNLCYFLLSHIIFKYICIYLSIFENPHFRFQTLCHFKQFNIFSTNKYVFLHNYNKVNKHQYFLELLYKMERPCSNYIHCSNNVLYGAFFALVHDYTSHSIVMFLYSCFI